MNNINSRRLAKVLLVSLGINFSIGLTCIIFDESDKTVQAKHNIRIETPTIQKKDINIINQKKTNIIGNKHIIKKPKIEQKEFKPTIKQNKKASRGSKIIPLKNNIEKRTFTLTFYTDLPSENGGYTGNCLGQKLQGGMVANNTFKLGTKIILDKFGEVCIADRGGNNFNNSNRLDVFIPRNNGESEYEYFKRVNNMGRVQVQGYIIE